MRYLEGGNQTLTATCKVGYMKWLGETSYKTEIWPQLARSKCTSFYSIRKLWFLGFCYKMNTNYKFGLVFLIDTIVTIMTLKTNLLLISSTPSVPRWPELRSGAIFQLSYSKSLIMHWVPILTNIFNTNVPPIAIK